MHSGNQSISTIERGTSMQQILTRLCLTLCVWAPLAALAQTDPALRFMAVPAVDRSYTLSQFKEALPAETIHLFDTQHGKEKNYRGFPLAAVLNLAFGPDWQHENYTEMIFTALDGYAAVSTLDKLGQSGGYLVFEDLDVTGWELIGSKQANPGPYYLVWSQPQQTTQNQYPWPWGITRIELVRFQDRYPRVYPLGVEDSSDVFQGFLTFKRRCMRCHALDQQGGKIGPDLDAPQSVTEYRSPAMLKAYIRQPSAFRYTQMPDHTDLSEKQLDQIVDYLRHQAKQ
ncbi:MAG: cytochrome c [Xanthomonadales bacterium]|nr:cytochrome c [Xanthomonadales bacterium]